MGSSLHILVVDDRPDSVLFLTEFLLSRHHRVETCNHAIEALEAIVRRHRTSEAYDLLISDVSMPGMDGLALLREIRRRQMLVPIALYTAYGSMHPNLASQAKGLGCLGVLEKPIELRHIDRLLDEVMSRRQGTGRQGTARQGTARQTTRQVEKEQPFFGTSRVARTDSTTTKSHRRETNQPADFNQPESGGYALEPKPAVPLPPAQPLIRHHTPIPLPTEPTPHIPPPIRSPLPFPDGQQEPQTRSMPSFRTPLPQSPERRDGAGRTANPAFRTPLPFLQNNQPVAPVPPMIPPTVASSPQVRTSHFEKPPATPASPPVVPGSAEPDEPPQPNRPTTAFIRRSVNPPTTQVVRASGKPLTEDQPSEPQGNLSGTSRIRRTVTGSYAPPTVNAPPTGRQQPPGPGTTRAVACAHCNKVFMVASRPVSYTAVCVHCGQLNRIDPL